MRRAIRSVCSMVLAVGLIACAWPISAQAADLSALVKQFEVKAEKYYTDEGFSSNHYEYTSAELRMLAVVIHMEARGEPYGCMLAVGNVVMNRVLASGYPGDTIASVVQRPNQFCYSPTVSPSAQCMQAARDILEHEVWVVPQNTYFFRASASRSDWGSHDFAIRLGRTAFYRHSYAGRSNASAIPAALFQRVTHWPQYGCKPGARVRKVQQMLADLGYGITADGYFGQSTKDALVCFQKAKRIKADGVAGPATLRALILAYGVGKFSKL